MIEDISNNKKYIFGKKIEIEIELILKKIKKGEKKEVRKLKNNWNKNIWDKLLNNQLEIYQKKKQKKWNSPIKKKKRKKKKRNNYYKDKKTNQRQSQTKKEEEEEQGEEGVRRRREEGEEERE